VVGLDGLGSCGLLGAILGRVGVGFWGVVVAACVLLLLRLGSDGGAGWDGDE